MLYFIKQQKNPISAYAKIRPYRKVLVAGLEPARSCPRGILSPLRLPVPPHQPNENYYSIGKMKKQLFFLENLTVKGVFWSAFPKKTECTLVTIIAAEAARCFLGFGLAPEIW